MGAPLIFIRRARDWLASLEPISRADKFALIAFFSGVAGWMFGSPGFLSHVGALLGGIGLGMMHRDRQQRAHERRMAQQQAEHNAALREIANLDLQTLALLSEHVDGADGGTAESRRCPRCGAVSYNWHDIKRRYCGACHDWT